METLANKQKQQTRERINNMRYCSLDIETTGLDPKTNNIIEFGAVIADLQDPKPIMDLPFFHAYVLPPNGNKNYVGSPFALSLHSKIFERIANREQPEIASQYLFLKPEQVAEQFRDFLISHLEGYSSSVSINAAGKNFSGFDLPFLREQLNIEKYVKFSHRVLDPSILYVREDDEGLPDSKECIRRMNERFSLDRSETVAHTAVDDALMIVELLRYGLKGRIEE